MKILNQTGQVVVILLMVMLVALTIALAIAQRSLVDLSTSNKSEQSSRAFSAAEAGLEQVLHGGSNTNAVNLSNQSSAKVSGGTSAKRMPQYGATGLGVGVEYPPFGKDTVAQFWLMDPFYNQSGLSNFPVPNSKVPSNYPNSLFFIYYGSVSSYSPTGISPPDVYPAIEVNFIAYGTDPVTPSQKIFKSFKAYYDESYSTRSKAFIPPDTCNHTGLTSISNQPNTTEGSSRIFVCKVTVNPSTSFTAAGWTSSNDTSDIPVMVRVRILYSDIFQPVAIVPKDNISQFPPQVTLAYSTGLSGQSQKQIKIFQSPFIVPSFLDFAIFSLTPVQKCLTQPSC